MKQDYSHFAAKFFMVILSVTALGGCNLDTGIAAFQSGDYQTAYTLLDPYIESWRPLWPGERILTVNVLLKKKCEMIDDCDAGDTADEINAKVAKKSFKYYAAWEAHTGALIAMEQIPLACSDIQLALRELTVHVFGTKKHFTRDPWLGDFWPNGVISLRAWWENLNCVAEIDN